jgi:hypothetical protein
MPRRTRRQIVGKREERERRARERELRALAAELHALWNAQEAVQAACPGLPGLYHVRCLDDHDGQRA